MATTWELAGLRRGLRKGLKEGVTKGIEKGRLEGKQDDLLLVLEKKFGELSTGVKGRVRKIRSARKLDSLLLAVLDARSVGELGL